METTPATNLGTGFFVLLGFVALFFLATQTTRLQGYFDAEGYLVTARFEDVAGLKRRARVTMSGVTIGQVERIEFDKNSLDAVVTMKIRAEFGCQHPDLGTAGQQVYRDWCGRLRFIPDRR